MKKIKLLKNILFPKQQLNHGLKKKEISFNSTIVKKIISFYTREAGVRNLEKEIAKICRKSVKVLETSNKKNIILDKKTLNKFLGVEKFRNSEIEKKNLIGSYKRIGMDRSWRRNFVNRSIAIFG